MSRPKRKKTARRRAEEKRIDLAAAVRGSMALLLPRMQSVAPPPGRKKKKAAVRRAAPLALPAPPPGVLLNKWPAPTGVPGDAFGIDLINTTRFAADGKVKQVVVANDTGRMLWICLTRIWLGVDKNRTCDAHGQLYRNDGSTLEILPCDHYADGPTGAGRVMTAHPRHFALPPDWMLAFNYVAFPIGPPTGAHFIVSLEGYYQ